MQQHPIEIRRHTSSLGNLVIKPISRERAREMIIAGHYSHKWQASFGKHSFGIFREGAEDEADCLGFAPSPLAALEVTARADVWPKVRHALLEAALSQDPPFDPLPRPDALCAQLLGELVARVNLVQTVPEPAPDIVRMELLEACGRTTDNAEEAATLVLTALDPSAAQLLPRLLVASGVDPSAGRRQPPASLSFHMPPA